MDGWMDGWMDEWMDEWMDGWMDGWADRLMNGWVDGRMDGWMDEVFFLQDERGGFDADEASSAGGSLQNGAPQEALERRL